MSPTFIAGQGEGALLELVGVSVDAGAILQQHTGHLHVACTGRLHQRRVAVLIVVLDVSTFLEQHFHHIHKATCAGVRQGSVAC